MDGFSFSFEKRYECFHEGLLCCNCILHMSFMWFFTFKTCLSDELGPWIFYSCWGSHETWRRAGVSGLHICYCMGISTSSLAYGKNSKRVSNDGRSFWQSVAGTLILYHFIKFVILIIFNINFSVTYDIWTCKTWKMCPHCSW